MSQLHAAGLSRSQQLKRQMQVGPEQQVKTDFGRVLCQLTDHSLRRELLDLESRVINCLHVTGPRQRSKRPGARNKKRHPSQWLGLGSKVWGMDRNVGIARSAHSNTTLQSFWLAVCAEARKLKIMLTPGHTNQFRCKMFFGGLRNTYAQATMEVTRNPTRILMHTPSTRIWMPRQ